jgi:hypothetical protein
VEQTIEKVLASATVAVPVCSRIKSDRLLKGKRWAAKKRRQRLIPRRPPQSWPCQMNHRAKNLGPRR